MTNVNQYIEYAETALVAYASALTSTTGVFNSPHNSNSFSAVLLKNRGTGEKIFAVRGTEPSRRGTDYVTDIAEISATGNPLRTERSTCALQF